MQFAPRPVGMGTRWAAGLALLASVALVALVASQRDTHGAVVLLRVDTAGADTAGQAADAALALLTDHSPHNGPAMGHGHPQGVAHVLPKKVAHAHGLPKKGGVPPKGVGHQILEAAEGADEEAAEEVAEEPAAEEPSVEEPADEEPEAGEEEPAEHPVHCAGPCVSISRDLGNYVLEGTLHVTLSPEEAKLIMEKEQQTAIAIQDAEALLPEVTRMSNELTRSRGQLGEAKEELSSQEREQRDLRRMVQRIRDARGPQGEKGPPGSEGYQGPLGISGPAPPLPESPMAVRGAAGGPGKDGFPGLAGVPGRPGKRGPRGSEGPPGIGGINGKMGPMVTTLLALSQSIWARRFGGPGLFSAQKLTGLYWKPSMSTWE
jgi:hypothetical protein